MARNDSGRVAPLAYEAVLLFLTDELRNVETPRVYELSAIPAKAGMQSVPILCSTTFSPHSPRRS